MIRWLQWCHRWLGAVILVQVLIWLATGFYFAVMGNAAMSGNGQRSGASHEPLASIEFVERAELPEFAENARSVDWRVRFGYPQMIIETGTGTEVFDGTKGTPWRTTEAMARDIARASYTGSGALTDVTETAQTFEVDFDDSDNTSVVIDKSDGAVIKHVTTTSAIADWMFRLHFMDYSGGKDFNNLLIRASGLLALWFALSGMILLARNVARGDLWRPQSLLNQLQKQQLPVKTVCGGGGTCGMCRVQFCNNAPPVSSAGKTLLTPAEVAQGIRLSCQQKRLPKHRADDVKILDRETLRELFQQWRRLKMREK